MTTIKGALKKAPRVLSAVASDPFIAGKMTGALARGRFRDAWRIARTTAQRPSLRTEKIVSRRYRFLWLCVPKAASRSLVAALLDADPDAEIFRGVTVREIYATRPEAKDYYSFAFVRHPFGRAFSWYWEIFFAHKIYAETYGLYSKQKERSFFDAATGRSMSLTSSPSEAADPRWKDEKRRSFFRRYHAIDERSTFDDFCRWLNTPFGSDAFADDHFLSQHLLVDLGDGRRPDFIGRVENIDADLNRVARHRRMPMPVLLQMNTRAGWLSTPEALKAATAAQERRMTERNKELLRKRYAADFALGGYSPLSASSKNEQET